MAEALETVFVNVEARLQRLEAQLNESVNTSRRKGQEAGQGYAEGFQRSTRGVEEALSRLGQIAVGGAIVQQFRNLAAEASQSRIAVDLFARQLERTGQSAQAGLAALDQVASRLGTLPSSLADNATQLLRQGLSFQDVITVFERAAASGLAAGKSTQQAIDAVTQAIVNQQSIYLNYAGISQNLDVAYKEFAQSLGKATDELTQQERAQAAVALIVKATKEEYEDLDRMLGGLGGTTAQLNKAQAQLRQELGAAVIPIINQMTQAGLSLVRALNGLPPELKAFAAQATLTGGVLLTLAGAFGGLIGQIGNLIPVLASLRAAMLPLFGPAGLFVAAAAALGALAASQGWIRLNNQMESTARSAERFRTRTGEALRGAVADQAQVLAIRQQQLEAQIRNIEGRSRLPGWLVDQRALEEDKKRLGELRDELRLTQQSINALKQGGGNLTAAAADAANRTVAAVSGGPNLDQQITRIRQLNDALERAKKSGTAKEILEAQKALDGYIGKNEQLREILSAVQQEYRGQERTARAARTEQTRAIREVNQAAEQWKSTLASIAFNEFERSLDRLTLAQLKQAAATAFANRSAQQYQAILNEITERQQAVESLLNNERLRGRAEAFRRLSDAELASRRNRAVELRDAETLSLVLTEQNRRREERQRQEEEYWNLYTQGAQARVLGERAYIQELERNLQIDRERKALLIDQDNALKDRIHAEQERLRRDQERQRAIEELNKALRESNELAQRFRPPEFAVDFENRIGLLQRAFEAGVIGFDELAEQIQSTINIFEDELANLGDDAGDKALELKIKIQTLKNLLRTLGQDDIDVSDAADGLGTLSDEVERFNEAFELGLIGFEDYARNIEAIITVLEQDLEGITDKTSAEAIRIARQIQQLRSTLNKLESDDPFEALGAGEGLSDLRTELQLLEQEFGLGLVTLEEYARSLDAAITVLQQDFSDLADQTSEDARRLLIQIAELQRKRDEVLRRPELLGLPIQAELGTDFLAQAIQEARDLGLFIAQQGLVAAQGIGNAIIAAFFDGSSTAAQILVSAITDVFESVGNLLLRDQLSRFAEQFSSLVGRGGDLFGGLGAGLAALNPAALLLGLGLPLIGNLLGRLFQPAPSAQETVDQQRARNRQINQLQLNYVTNVSFNVEGDLGNTVVQSQIEERLASLIRLQINDYDRRVVRPALEQLGVRYVN